VSETPLQILSAGGGTCEGDVCAVPSGHAEMARRLDEDQV